LNDLGSTAAFVMPHWTDDFDRTAPFLNNALQGIYSQSDSDWILIIVDDSSPCEKAKSFLKQLELDSQDKIQVIFNEENNGPGFCRNIAINRAYELNLPFILFNDDDDISHVDRLKVVRNKFQNDQIDVVYSTFQVIDEYDELVEMKDLAQIIQEILEGHDQPLSGRNVWMEMGTVTGYTNLTSSTSVRTKLACEFPFPSERVSEDYFAWMVYSAGGNEFYFTNEIPTKYRIPRYVKTSTASRIKDYFREQARVDELGFREALKTAKHRNPSLIDEAQEKELIIGFYFKLAETLNRENQDVLVKETLDKAKLISLETYKTIKDKYPTVLTKE
jgi:glycosyltransferase involved in cell wall biosynthesis